MNSAVPEISRNIVRQKRSTLARLLCRGLFSVAAVHAMGAATQAQGVEARIASVNGRAVLSGNSRPVSDLVRGVAIVPGDVIDTRPGGRATIQLSDGSLVIVQPGSVVVFQDYRNAGSLRELLKITVGRVRVRINHFGGRPNPYRVNSPTASIAVRGTEFSVAVSAVGDTEVVVYEGLVEVASVSHPLRRVLVEAGHGVIVRANDDVQFFVPGLSKEIGERTKGERGHDQESFDESDPSVPISKPAENSPRTASGVYERYFDNIVENGETPLPSRFAAFPDSHFDSIENPAFATDFTATDGRIFFLPSMGGTRENDNARQLFGLGDPRSVDYGLSPQGSLFVPLPKFRAVIGGRVAYSRDGFQALTLDNNAGLTGAFFAPGTTGKRAIDGATTNRLFAASLMAARRFGSNGRTSVGFGVDYFSTRGRLSNTITQT
ncbi:MAG TPA: FecR family protein, partial [Pyrinomonadaceae bacterium]|nr:FecR family protein [Pyrinomonadaceae bacterium]